MKFSIGDKVRFLNDVGGGTVVKILSKNMVMVQDNSGFEYPYPESELVLINPVSKMVTGNAQNDKSEQKHESEKDIKSKSGEVIDYFYKNDNKTNIYFAFCRKKDDKEDGFETYLINDSDYTINYIVFLRGDNGWQKLDNEILEPNTKIMTNFLSREIINKSKEIVIQMMFVDHPVQIYHSLIERKINIIPLELFQEYRFKDNEFLDDKAYLFILLKEELGLGNKIDKVEDLSKIIEEKEIQEEDKSKKFKSRKEPEIVEVDLHINCLVDSVVGMSNAEILEIQMKKFHETMTDAIMRRVSKVIIIHGIGNGTLKSAIRESLSQQYKLKFEDASFREYGFGATMVLLE